MNVNELYVVKEYIFDNPLITDIDSKREKRFRDCHKNCFHNFKYECEFDIKLTNSTNNETINITISDKSMGMYEMNR